MRQLAASITILGLILAPVGALAASFVFDNGAGNSDWDVAQNWNPETGFAAALPDIGAPDTFTVGDAFSPTQDAGSQVEVGFSGSGTATLNIDTSGTLTFEGCFAGRNASAQITQNSGTWNVGSVNGMGWAFSAAGVLARYDMNGGSLNNVGFTYLCSAAGASAVVVQTGGAVTEGDGSGGDYFMMAPSSDGAVASYQISGGSLTINSGTDDIGIGETVSAWGGPSDGGAATFEVVGTGPSAITWNGNTLIGGAGSGKGKLKYTMGDGGVTALDINGTVSLIDSPLLELDFTGYSGSGDITLIDNDLADAISGTFSGAPEGTGYGPGDRFTLTYIGGDGNDLVLVDGGVATPGAVIYAK